MVEVRKKEDKENIWVHSEVDANHNTLVLHTCERAKNTKTRKCCKHVPKISVENGRHLGIYYVSIDQSA